jgi:DNA-binding LacI/PurR family transcriptional regulator
MVKKRPTIKDVAQKAQVSTATVSFVLNNRPGQIISERVKERVWRAAEQLEYHPSASAAGLARQRTNNVAILFYQSAHLISNLFYSFVIQGAIREATQREYNLIFSYVDRDYRGPADLPKVIRERNTEGVLSVQRISLEMIADIQTRGVPVVAVDSHPIPPGVGSLQMDNRRGGALAAEHLLELGHRKIVIIIGHDRRPSIDQRVDGFIETAVARGVPLNLTKSVVQAEHYSFGAGYTTAKRLIAQKRRPTAIFCANDEMAAGVLRAATELGISVPRDLSVVGFDDITLSAYMSPPLTTVGGDKERLGARAMARLLDMVEGGEQKQFREDVGMDLVLRDSTGPVPS